jgi:hypothetical protein
MTRMNEYYQPALFISKFHNSISPTEIAHTIHKNGLGLVDTVDIKRGKKGLFAIVKFHYWNMNETLIVRSILHDKKAVPIIYNYLTKWSAFEYIEKPKNVILPIAPTLSQIFDEEEAEISKNLKKIADEIEKERQEQIHSDWLKERVAEIKEAKEKAAEEAAIKLAEEEAEAAEAAEAAAIKLAEDKEATAKLFKMLKNLSDVDRPTDDCIANITFYYNNPLQIPPKRKLIRR